MGDRRRLWGCGNMSARCAPPNTSVERPADAAAHLKGRSASYAIDVKSWGVSGQTHSPPEKDNMPDAPEARHLGCSICSQLRDQEHALQTVQGDEEDTSLPEAANRLEVARDIQPGVPGLQLKRCPECGTYYLLRSIYEFLIGFGGSYDEYFLTRVTDEVGADYWEPSVPTCLRHGRLGQLL